jgi:hypothetical protein
VQGEGTGCRVRGTGAGCRVQGAGCTKRKLHETKNKTEMRGNGGLTGTLPVPYSRIRGGAFFLVVQVKGAENRGENGGQTVTAVDRL